MATTIDHTELERILAADYALPLGTLSGTVPVRK